MFIPKPVVLCILDGWGYRADNTANAPALAHTPHFDATLANNPSAFLTTHGPDVGLPSGQMGNSEVGHTNIGAGRVVAMDLGQIDLAIEDGSFFENQAILDFIEKLKASGGVAHVIGLASPGGVHSHQDHIAAAARMLDQHLVPCAVHVITDGRDVAPKSALEQVSALQDALPDGPAIVTVSGRYFAMDRDNRWERVQAAYDAMAHGVGAKASNIGDAIANAYASDTTDEFIPATVLDGYHGMNAGDGLFCLNFRSDRAREILEAFANPVFEGFEREMPDPAAYLGMGEYSDRHNAWYETVFPKRDIKNTLGSWVAQHGLSQFRLAETEKYPHVTFFKWRDRNARRKRRPSDAEIPQSCDI